MKSNTKVTVGLVIGAIICSNLLAFPVLAYNLELITDMPVKNDFVLGPSYHELLLAPGETAMVSVSVSNRYPNEKRFAVDLEDFSGSSDMQSSIQLLGDAKGPYSLRDFIHPEITNFNLEHGERIIIPIKIEIPINAAPGGLFGSVIIKTVPLVTPGQVSEGRASGGITVTSRVASLLYVRVKGEAKEEGHIKEFTADKKIYGQPPINFEYIYQNDGNVYLKPYGELTVDNLTGTRISTMVIDPFFVMPGSLRQMKQDLDKGFMFGRYTATLMLHRSYLSKDVIDRQTVTFSVLPWKTVTAIILILFLIIMFIRVMINWFHRNFERKPKNSSDNSNQNKTPPTP